MLKYGKEYVTSILFRALKTEMNAHFPERNLSVIAVW